MVKVERKERSLNSRCPMARKIERWRDVEES
jgi:hypothetical protein